jgi:hypothetical protein
MDIIFIWGIAVDSRGMKKKRRTNSRKINKQTMINLIVGVTDMVVATTVAMVVMVIWR